MARPVTTEESDRRRAELDAQRAAANPALHALRADAKAIRAALLAGTLAATPDMEATILRTLETAERALLTAEGTALALGAALAGISRLPAPAAEPSINHHRRRRRPRPRAHGRLVRAVVVQAVRRRYPTTGRLGRGCSVGRGSREGVPMSVHRRAARRDSNEPEIVKALLAAGASVTHLSGVDGLPDLLVGYRGATFLLEVKLPLGPRGGKRGGGSTRPGQGGDGVLSADQLAWWQEWRGASPVIVRTPAEALAAIGATS